MKLLSVPYHFLLVPLFVPLHLLANNPDFFEMQDAYRVIRINFTCALLLFLIMFTVYRSMHRAALGTSATIALLFTFSTLNETVFRASSGIVTLVIVSGLVLTMLFAVWRSNIGNPHSTAIINACLTAMIIVPVYTLAKAHLHGASDQTNSIENNLSGHEPGLDLSRSSVRPNIIHIVLDGYVRHDLLLKIFGVDTSTFLTKLRQLGFYVADQSVTPYGQTILSMNAILSMNYLDNTRKAIKTANPDIDGKLFRKILAHRLDHSPVLRALKSIGYQIVVTEVDYPPVQLENVDYVMKRGDPRKHGDRLNEFERLVYGYTPVYGILEKLLDLETNRDTIIRALTTTGYEKLKSPYFIYNHVVAPHPPFGINRYGNARPHKSAGLGDGTQFLKDDARRFRAYRDGYAEKVRWTNQALVRYIKNIIDGAKAPTIVLVHGDHGSGLFLDHESADKTCLKERFSILLAVYDSEGRLGRAIRPDFNLVNLYRVVLNEAFDTKLSMLDDHSYFAPWSKPMELQQIQPARLVEDCGEKMSTKFED